jgi:hypothetical protein
MITLHGLRTSWRTSLLGAAVLLAAIPNAAHAIPAWARKYNMNCTGCHYPVPPVLNADGLAFKWAGYRMPDQIGKNEEVTKIGDYFAARGVFQYAYTKTSGEPADNNSLTVPSASIFAAGALGKWFGGFLELEAADDGVGVAAQASGTWGSEDSYGGVRVVQGHLMSEGAVAGLDRAIGPLTPLAIDGPITTAVPFGFGDHNGVDFAWVFSKKDRLAIGYSSSMAPVLGGSTIPSGDFFISNQFVWDVHGGGLSVIGYYGSATGLDSINLDQTSHYYRVGATALHYFGTFEANGGYFYGKDMDLPTGDLFSTSTITGQSYWLGAGYTFPSTYLTFYGRWEVVDPDKTASDLSTTRWVFGGVAPLMTPQNIRLGLEYFNDQVKMSGSPSRQGVALELQVAY